MSGSESEGAGRVVAGRYRLEHMLGRGGMGVVWRATDTVIERPVALKELRPPAGEEEASFVERARREARNAGRLNHPGIVAVHDVISPTGDDGSVYIVMEYVEAPTLADIIEQQGPLPAPRVAAMGVGILDALTAAHAMGIVHRDIKPSNVLVGAGDRVKLTDFGIALAAEDSRLTRTGVMGTHAYLAPEAFDDGQVGPAADLWALGATLFHAVAGRAPFERDTATATLRAILIEDPPAPPCPPPLADVIAGLLSRRVDQRLAADAARRELERAAAAPAGPPTAATDPAGGAVPGGWAAQATTLHRSPGPVPLGTTQPAPPPPGGQTTQPGGPPPPFATAQPGSPLPPPAPPGPPGPGQPAGFAPLGPPPGAAPSGQWTGPPPKRSNNTPLVLGGLVAAALVLVLVIVMAGGGSDDDDGGGETGSGGPLTEQPTGDTPGDSDGADPDGGADPAGGSPPAGDLEANQAVAQGFLDAVNSGDEATAGGMLCEDTQDVVGAELATVVAGGASLEMVPEETDVDDSGMWTRLAGTADGTVTETAFMTTSNTDAGPCVMQFDTGLD